MRGRRGGARTWAWTAVLAVALALPAGAAGADAPPPFRDGDYADGQAMSVLPPGSNGLVNGPQLAAFQATGARPANSDDQLGRYAGLIHGTDGLTDEGLGSFFNDASFGVRAEDVVSTVRPTPGVVIHRDRIGVPHVYGDTDELMAFGAGYAQAEDRLFLMDVLRHYGSGTLASFLGPSCEFQQMDHDQLLLAPYTPERARAQVDALPAQYGADGVAAKSLIESYVRGINAYIAQARMDPSKTPADYVAALEGPQDWTVVDVVSIAGLIGGIFGKGGGAELANAELLQYLQRRSGAEAGRRQFDELKRREDPAAPTTTDRRFPYDEPGRAYDPAKTALPDDASRPLTGGPVATTPGCAGTAPNPAGLRIAKALEAMPDAMSNALVVNADEARDGHPIAVFGPQVSYFAPQILSVIDLHSPNYAAVGASFPGTGLVELGRGSDYAWSATSAGTDLIDQRLERVCDPAGGAPQAEGKHYLFDGECRPMVKETYTQTAVPKPGGPGLPTVISRDIYRTVHGVVQGWTTSGGRPVAVVNQRSTYEHDVDSVVGFLRWGRPGQTRDYSSWVKGAEQINYTFNWFYVDDEQAGYYMSGRNPVRAAGADPDLPTWGSGEAEWQGDQPSAEHPQDVDPASGHLVSWNNKPAPGFAAADDQYGYGSVYRSQLLDLQLAEQRRRHPEGLTRADLVQAMGEAATQDLDGVQVLPTLLAAVDGRPHPDGVTRMLDLLRRWQADGSHRRTARQGDAQYEHAGAVAAMDELQVRTTRALFDPLLAAGGIGAPGAAGAGPASYDVLPMVLVNTPNGAGAHQGSAYQSGYEGSVKTLLAQVDGQAPADAFTPATTDAVCGARGLADCPAALDAALEATYAALVQANGGQADPAAWTASPETAAAGETMVQHDAIEHRALGIVGQPPIEWQNRPTFQQVVQFPRGRVGGAGAPDGTTAPPGAPATPSAPGAAGASGGAPPAAGTRPPVISQGTGSVPCRSRRVVRITLPRRIRSAARVTVNGRRVAVTRSRGRFTARIDLRLRGRTRVTVRQRGRTASGRTITRTRSFRTCTPRRR